MLFDIVVVYFDIEVVLIDIECDVVGLMVVLILDIGFVVAVELVPVAEVYLPLRVHLGRNLRNLQLLGMEGCYSEKKIEEFVSI